MQQITVPSPGESISEVTLGPWLKQDGDWVDTDEVLVDVESEKATLEVRAPAAGVLRIKGTSGTEQKVGAVIAEVDTAAAKPAGAGAAAAKPVATAPAAAKPAVSVAARPAVAAAPRPGAGAAAEPKVSSVARKMASERGLNLATVPGSGPAGRVMKADVERATSSLVSAFTAVATSHASSSRGVVREKMPKIRQKIAERLVHAQHSAAMLTTFNEVDMTEVLRLRGEYKEAFEKQHGVGLGFMSFFVKAACSALKKFPKVNAYIVGDEYEYHDYCDVAVAVGTDRGLVVPVLRDAQELTFAGIEAGIKELATRARDGKLTVDEMTGGTFTITNGGIYGSLMSTPILNSPQSGILGMHAIKKRAVEDPANAGSVAIRPMMYLALSYDHRIVDGAEAVSFLVHIKECIERPERMLIL